MGEKGSGNEEEGEREVGEGEGGAGLLTSLVPYQYLHFKHTHAQTFLLPNYLVLCDLHMCNEVVDQLGQDGREESLQAAALTQHRDELKDGKGRPLSAYHLTITVTHLIIVRVD